jgi:hypothetical protein
VARPTPIVVAISVTVLPARASAVPPAACPRSLPWAAPRPGHGHARRPGLRRCSRRSDRRRTRPSRASTRNSRRPPALVISMPWASTTSSTPCRSSSPTTSMRCRTERPIRSSLVTTRASPRQVAVADRQPHAAQRAGALDLADQYGGRSRGVQPRVAEEHDRGDPVRPQQRSAYAARGAGWGTAVALGLRRRPRRSLHPVCAHPSAAEVELRE